jgi:hypothetical protein
MPDQQQVNTGAPISQPAAAPVEMTPELARERIAELNTDREWGAKLLSGDLAVRRENDRLLEIAAGLPAREQPNQIATPEQAKSRLEELNTDAVWRKKFFAGDLSARKEFDRLTELAANVPAGTANRAKDMTPAEARAAELEAVPDSPEGYHVNWRGDPPPPEGVQATTGWMHAAGLSRAESSEMLHFAAKDVGKWMQMNDPARELHIQDTLARFNKMHGDQAPAMLAGAKRLVAELCKKDPTLKSFLEESGAGASLGVISALANAAKRRYRA